MDKETKRRWLEALRSGKYTQCQGILRRRSGNGYAYCALGVFCDLVAPQDWVYSDPDMGWVTRNWIGTMKPMHWHHQNVILHMNDRSKSFAEIADWIEENVATDEEVARG